RPEIHPAPRRRPGGRRGRGRRARRARAAAHPQRADRFDEGPRLRPRLSVRARCAGRSRGSGTSARVTQRPALLSTRRSRSGGRARPPAGGLAPLARAAPPAVALVAGTAFATLLIGGVLL